MANKDTTIDHLVLGMVFGQLSMRLKDWCFDLERKKVPIAVAALAKNHRSEISKHNMTYVNPSRVLL